MSVNPFANGNVDGVAAFSAPNASFMKNYPNHSQVPKGMVALFDPSAKTSGYPPIIGYADPNSTTVVFFNNASNAVKQAAQAAVDTGKATGTLTFQGGPPTVTANLTKTQTGQVAAATGAQPAVDPKTGAINFNSGSLAQTGVQSAQGGPIPSFGYNADGTKIADPTQVGTQTINFDNPDGTPATQQVNNYGVKGIGSKLAGLDRGSGDNNTTGQQLSVDQATDALYGMSATQIKALQTQLTQAGYGKFNADGIVTSGTGGLVAAYQQLLLNAYNYQQSGNPTMTPQKLLDQQAAAGGKSSLPKDTTATETTLTNASQSQGLLLTAMQQLLGRDPTPDEVTTFQQSLNADQAANPKTITSSTQTDAYGNAKQQTTSGGVGGLYGPSDYATQWVNQNFGPQVNAGKVGSLLSIIQAATGVGGGVQSGG